MPNLKSPLIVGVDIFPKRRDVLESIVKLSENKIQLSRQVKVTMENVEEAEYLFTDSLNKGHEGIMIKDPNEPYIPGIQR